MTDNQFIYVQDDDRSRWVEYPDKKIDQIYFDAYVDIFDYQFDGAHPYVVIDFPYDNIRIFNTDDYEITANFIKLNAHVWHTNPTAYGVIPNGQVTLTIIGYTPDYYKHSPSKIIDRKTELTIARLTCWDPARNWHTPNPTKKIDTFYPRDPVHETVEHYPDDSRWTDQMVGTVWVNSTTLGYVPYYDETQYQNIIDQMNNWGQLADWADFTLYEWTKSPVPPSGYTKFVEQNQGNNSLDSRNQPSGIPRKAIMYQGNPVPVDQLHLNVSGAQKDFPNTSTHFDLNSRVDLFINGKFVETTDFGTVRTDFNNEKYSVNQMLHLTRNVQDSQGNFDVGYSEEYDFITTDTIEDDGSINKIYYFWTYNKKTKGPEETLSLVNAQAELTNPSVPYQILSGFSYADPTQEFPDRYTKLHARNIDSVITANDRYKLQLTFNDVLRDKIRKDDNQTQTSYSTPSQYYSQGNMLGQKYEHWELFRKDDERYVPRELWLKLTESVMGIDLITFEDTGQELIIPTTDRVNYDAQFGTNTRYGLERGQTMADREQLVNIIYNTILDSSFDAGTVDKFNFLDVNLFDTPVNSKKAMDSIYSSFPLLSVNHLFFECLNDTLAARTDVNHIMKTSFLSIHGIKLLETEKND